MTDAPSDRPVAAVPTSSWRPGDPSRLALLIGTVEGGGTSDGHFCVWVRRESGEIVPVVWPAGFRARLDPLELLNAQGAIAAAAGDRINVCGGLMPVDPGRPCSLGLDNTFYVMDEMSASNDLGLS
jgi:hypothetical protein